MKERMQKMSTESDICRRAAERVRDSITQFKIELSRYKRQLLEEAIYAHRLLKLRYKLK